MKAINPARLLLALITAATITAMPKIAQADAVEEACTNIYSSWTQYFARQQCVKERRKAEKTRICITKDLERMESLAKEIKESIRENMPLADAKKAMQEIMGKDLPIGRAKDDASDRVINTEITTNCASAFQFVVQVRAAPSGTLRHLKIWTKFPPAGYPGGYRPALSRDFEAELRQRQVDRRRRSAAVAKKRAHQRLMAEARKRRERENLRKRKQRDAAIRRRAEDARKRRELAVIAQREALAAPPPNKNHCAPNLSKHEHLRRLRRFGTVRRTGAGKFRAGAHGIGFTVKGGDRDGEKKIEVAFCQ